MRGLADPQVVGRDKVWHAAGPAIVMHLAAGSATSRAPALCSLHLRTDV